MVTLQPLVFTLLAALCAAPAAARDTMSYGGISWTLHIGDKAAAYAVRQATAPDGRAALRFELRAGDCMANEIDDCATHRERAELRAADEAALGSERWYRYSVLVPADHPAVGVEEIIGQLHDGVTPVLSNRFARGRVQIVMQNRRGAKAASGGAAMAQGRWTEFVDHCRWSKGADGFCNVFVDGRKALAFTGPTVSAAARHGPYLKIGLYRSHLERAKAGATPTGVIYFSNVSTGAGKPF